MTDAATPATPPRVHARKAEGIPTTADEHTGFNGWLAVKITNIVGSMWCAYAFGALALISLPSAIHEGTFAIVSWISQTFLQLVLLSVIMVGQKVMQTASDKQAAQTYKDAEALLEITAKLETLIALNNAMTKDIHEVVAVARAKAAE